MPFPPGMHGYVCKRCGKGFGAWVDAKGRPAEYCLRCMREVASTLLAAIPRPAPSPEVRLEDIPF